MAVNATTLDQCLRTQIFVELPKAPPSFGIGMAFQPYAEAGYDRVTIDGTTYWEIIGPQASISPNGLRPRGIVIGQEFVGGNNVALPIARQGDRTQQAVWMYGGI